MAYTRHKTADFGAAKAAVTTWGYRLRDAGTGTYSTRVTAGIVRLQDPAGNFTGQVAADVEIPDAFRGLIVWDTGETVVPVPTAVEEIDAVTLDLTQPLSSLRSATVGGALHGSWAAAWGKIVLDVAARTLAIFGVGSQSVAAQTFDLNDGNFPSSRTPRP